MYKYKNSSNQDQMLPGIGEVAAGAEIDSLSPIENPNFEYIGKTNNESVVGTEAPQPGAIVEAQKLPETSGNLEVN